MSHDPPPNPRPDSRPEAFQPEHSAPPIAPIQTGGPLRRVLPWVLSAAAVLGLLLVMLVAVLPRVSQVPRHSQNPPLPSDSAAVLPPPSDPAVTPPSDPAVTPPLDPATTPQTVPPQTPAAAAPTGVASPPLAVTLYSAGSGKHIPVGKPVLISAYAALPSAGSATIAISYTRNGGPRSLLTLAQGSLSTASWTPALPGRYDFTASALDSRKISAFSRHITIDADAPPVAARPLPPPAVSPAPPPVRAAALVPAPRARPAPRPAAARPPTAERPAPKPAAAKRAAPLQAPRSRAYHVAAAAFVARPLAETLAGALRRRGFPASVQPSPGPSHKTSYVVQTGDYLRPADAQKQAALLKQDGYPAYVFQVR